MHIAPGSILTSKDSPFECRRAERYAIQLCCEGHAKKLDASTPCSLRSFRGATASGILAANKQMLVKTVIVLT